MTGLDYLLLAVVLVLIFLAAVLASAEVVVTRVSKVRAYHLQEEGKRGAASLVRIVDNPAPYLSVILLLLLLLHLSGTTIATVVAVRAIGSIGEVLATAVMTILLFVLAEVTPKTFAVQHTDRVALRVSPLIVTLTRLFGPLAKGLIKLANVIMPGKGLPEGPFVTEADIRAMADVATEEDQIEEEEKELIHSIFEFGDTVVREVMTPEPDIVAVEVSESLNAVQDLVIRHGFSRIPVYRGNMEDIVGVVYAKDVLRELRAGRSDRSLEDLARKGAFVPESKKVTDLLKEMQQQKFHLALVVDEYGSLTGLVTLEDLLEEIVGEIVDEYDREDPNVEPAGDGKFRVNGRLPVDELNELLDVDLPQEDWDSVGGLMMGVLGRVPSQGQQVEVRGIRFIAEQVTGRRIGKVLVERLPETEDEAAGEQP